MFSTEGYPDGVLAPAEVRRAASHHMPALDGLRGIAILLVLFAHLAWGPQAVAGVAGKLFLTVTTCGWTGVELFFVLSGFLITGILLDTRTAENYFTAFYARRALRILPLGYAMILLVCDLGPLLGKLGVPFLPARFSTAQLWFWLYAGNWAEVSGHGVAYLLHFWSLAVEEQFYLLWPLIVLACSRRTLAKLSIALVLLAPAIRIVFYAFHFDPLNIYFMTTSHFDPLALGALAAIVVRDENWTRRLIPCLNFLIYPCLAIFCFTGIMNGSLSNDECPTFIFGELPLVIFFTGVLLRAVATTGLDVRFQKYLQAGWLRAYGRYSYAIYVLHFPIVTFLSLVAVPALVESFRRSPLHAWARQAGYIGAPLFLVLGIIVVGGAFLFFLGLGKLSWWAFEGPINGLKKNFAPRYGVDGPTTTSEVCAGEGIRRISGATSD